MLLFTTKIVGWKFQSLKPLLSYYKNTYCLARALSVNVNVVEVENGLASIVGSKYVATSHAICEQHSHDESYHRHLLPSIVVWPQSVGEVSEVAKLCTAHKMPMIPFGTGTGMEGGVAPMGPSVSINLTKLNEITDLHLDDFDVKAQPGVTRKQLNYDLRSTGLWFPVDPGSDASLCGMAATGASGTNAVRYGTMKQNVLNLQVVLADGTILHTAGEKRRCKKSSAGYNLTELFIGSEGTLGFITSATLRLHGQPEMTKSAVCSFPTIMDAVNTAMQILQCSIPIARIELLDETSIKAVNNYSHLTHPEMPHLFLEFHGSAASTGEQVDQTAEIAGLNSGSEFKWAETQEEHNHLWQARHDLWYAVKAFKPGSTAISTDACVPVSALAEAISHSAALLDESGLIGGILGHVGDGNYHCFVIVEDDQAKLVESLTKAIGKKAIELGGTCTGEHGIGIGKRPLLKEEVGEKTLKLMKAIKCSFDPLGLMNPGKVFS
ncbi:unnamed protein product [Clavelina lepadiformis]|uniref:D-lactate dehydrogenase (cytochrome) n=1 Tax=Clavelina lepadiformis TaxID=159417 RepID=A0ABP0FQC5_CLALP